MGGRGSQGGTRSTYRGNSTQLFKQKQGKGTGGSGGSGGGSGGGSKGPANAGTGGIQTGGGSGSSSSSSTIVNTPLQAEFGSHISDARKNNATFLINRMPERHRRLLNHRGVKLYVDRRADQTPGWAQYAADNGIDSSTLTADGREVGDLSFYDQGKVFVSDASPHGSANVYVHELAHALDYHYLGGRSVEVEWPAGSGAVRFVTLISDDPDYIDMHSNLIVPNASVRDYYRTGSTGAHSSGRKESFAEGYAEYITNGREGVKRILGSYEVADRFINILTRYGVID